ncbi:hypothetical protein [Herbiconiux daphne]|uniref:Nucleotidyltransferase domain-containing protein n=1 Tax=Herbiconiux daphne TaxID=2970914 RepID=A0ABT2H1A1_9MICO|nr:hypothetical protein [Herbiconiux daphne]MCS5733685.1 hypothetical protein [Herbiconiux daphne]
MPDVIAEAFHAFAEHVRPTAGDVERAQQLRDRVANELMEDAAVLRVVDTGSFAHGTAVRESSHFDVFVVLRGAKPKSVARSIDVLRAAAAGAPAALVSASAESVLVEQLGAPGIRLIPAYEAAAEAGSSLGGSDLLWVPDVARRWVRHRAGARTVLLSRIDDDGSVRALIRLMLVWKHRQDVGISSYYLETAAIRQALQQSSFSLLWDQCWLWERLADDALSPLPDLTSPSQTQSVRAAASLARAIEAQFPLERAASSGRGAVSAYMDGDLDAATAYLRALYGSDFPEL